MLLITKSSIYWILKSTKLHDRCTMCYSINSGSNFPQEKTHWATSKDFFGYHIIGVLPASSDGDQCVHVQSRNHVQLFVTLWTVACLSMGFSQQEYWSGLTFLLLGDLPHPGIKPTSPALQVDSFITEPPGKPDMETRDADKSTHTAKNFLAQNVNSAEKLCTKPFSSLPKGEIISLLSPRWKLRAVMSHNLLYLQDLDQICFTPLSPYGLPR